MLIFVTFEQMLKCCFTDSYLTALLSDVAVWLKYTTNYYHGLLTPLTTSCEELAARANHHNRSIALHARLSPIKPMFPSCGYVEKCHWVAACGKAQILWDLSMPWLKMYIIRQWWLVKVSWIVIQIYETTMDCKWHGVQKTSYWRVALFTTNLTGYVKYWYCQLAERAGASTARLNQWHKKKCNILYFNIK